MSYQPYLATIAAHSNLVLVDYYDIHGELICRLGSSTTDPGTFVDDGDRGLFNGKSLNLSALPPSTPIGQILIEQQIMDSIHRAEVTLVSEAGGDVLAGTLYFYDSKGNYWPHFCSVTADFGGSGSVGIGHG